MVQLSGQMVLVEQALDFYVGEMVKVQRDNINFEGIIDCSKTVRNWQDSSDYIVSTITTPVSGCVYGGSLDAWIKSPINCSMPMADGENLIVVLESSLKIIKAQEVQRGKTLLVTWQGSISKSSFFHGLHHMVNKTIFEKQSDYNHQDILWWLLVDQFNRRFGK